MNRYPLWKYVLIAVALVVGIVFTVPNFFPEVPAVQVSSSKATVKVDNALLGMVEDTLKAAAIPYRGATLDATGVKLRFDDPDTQLKAKDASASNWPWTNGTWTSRVTPCSAGAISSASHASACACRQVSPSATPRVCP